MWYLMIASTIMQAFAQRSQAKAAAQEAEFQRREALDNAARAKADAELSERIADAEGVEGALESAQAAGSRRVAQAAGGGRLDVGTNFLIRVQDRAWAEWQATKAAIGSRARTAGFKMESLGFTRQAAQLKVRKSNIRTASRYQIAGTLLGGVATAYALKGSPAPSTAIQTGGTGSVRGFAGGGSQQTSLGHPTIRR